MSLYINADERLTLKEKFKKYNLIWQKYAPSKHIGNCAYLFDTLNPVSYEDFLDKYLISGTINNSPDIFYKGRDEYQLVDLAQSLYDDIKLSECLKIIIIHAIYETYDGHIYEHKIKQLFIKEKNTLLFKPSYLLDTKLGVDYVAYNLEPLIIKQQFTIASVKPDSLYLTINVRERYTCCPFPRLFFLRTLKKSLI